MFADSLYHAKIKARIDSVTKSTSDASKIDKRLRAKSGVNSWVPIVFGGVPVLGIVLAVALPAFQDRALAQVVSKPFTGQLDQTKPNGSVSAEPDWNKGVITPPATSSQTALPTLDLNEFARQFLRSKGIGGSQDAGDVVAWGDAQLAARNVTGDKRALAHKFAIQWQYQFERGMAKQPPHSLFLAYDLILNNLDRNDGLCRPDAAKASAIVDRGDGTSNAYWTCVPL